MKLVYGVFIAALCLVSGAYADIVKLSPQMRGDEGVMGKEIRGDELKPFLDHIRVLNKGQYDSLPELVYASPDKTILEIGDDFHSTNLPSGIHFYDLVQLSDELVDPETQSSLGVLTKRIGAAKLEKTNKAGLSKLRLIEVLSPISEGIKLVPKNKLLIPEKIMARKTNIPYIGRIISLVHGSNMEGALQPVVLNIGAAQGMADGTLLEIYSRKAIAIKQSRTWQAGGPEEINVEEDLQNLSMEDPIGEVMVYQTLDDVSFALITKANGPITNYDLVSSSI